MLTRPCPKCNGPIDLVMDFADAETVIYGGTCDECGEVEAVYTLTEINASPKPRVCTSRPDEYIAEDEAAND